MNEAKHKFHVLDGLRGVAAGAVLIFHAPLFISSARQVLPHGYLAVDFFFMLSGFVMAFSYQSKLDSGRWNTLRFMLERAARLYPVYIVGVALGLAFSVAQASVRSEHPTLVQTLTSVWPELFFMPDWLASHSRGELFSLNVPLWSLFFEMVAYLGYSKYLRNRSSAYLWCLLGVFWLLLVWQGLSHQSLDLGAATTTIIGGFVRVGFSYVGGMLVYRLWRGGFGRFQVSGVLVATALVGSLAFPFGASIYELLVVSMLFPMVLLLGAYSTEQPWMRSACINLGIVSYPLYVIHIPLIGIATRSMVRLHRIVTYTQFFIYLVPIIVFAAFFLEHFYDVPVRGFLKKKLSRLDQTASAS